MTGTKLLPLPISGSGFYEDNVWHDAFSKRQMEAYARDNVAHATAAKDAEIERMAGALRKIATLKVREYDDAVGIADETLDREKGIG